MIQLSDCAEIALIWYSRGDHSLIARLTMQGCAYFQEAYRKRDNAVNNSLIWAISVAKSIGAPTRLSVGL